MPKLSLACLFLVTILWFSLSAFGASYNYNNGPTNGTVNAFFVDVYSVSDSFVLNGHGGPTIGFTFAEWVPAGATPLTIDWSVGTSSFGNDVGSGVNTPISVANLLCSSGQPFNGGICGGGFGYDVYNSTVSTGNLLLNGGTTYWLTLTNATDNFGGRDGWDVNSGASTAYHNLLGQVPSESFTINVEGSFTTPEPSSIMLFGAGILGMIGVLRRKW